MPGWLVFCLQFIDQLNSHQVVAHEASTLVSEGSRKLKDLNHLACQGHSHSRNYDKARQITPIATVTFAFVTLTFVTVSHCHKQGLYTFLSLI